MPDLDIVQKEELDAVGVAPDGEVEDYMMVTANFASINVEDDVIHLEGDDGDITDFTFRVKIDNDGVDASTQEMRFYFKIVDDSAT